MISKKQTRILSFFKPKGQEEALKFVNTKSRLRNENKTSRRNWKVDSENVISLLSSDEDDENEQNEENQNVCLEIEGKIQPTTITTNRSMSVCDEVSINTSEFMEVTLDGEAGLPIVNNSEQMASTDEAKEQIIDSKLKNFRSMLEWVLDDESNGHLFNEEDRVVIDNFTSMSVLSQRLYVRLYVRKHRWLRSSRITYPDLGEDLKPLTDELVKNRLLSPCEAIDDLEEVLQLLDATELKSCAKSMNGVKLSQATSKHALIEAILKHARSSRSIKNFFSAKNLSVEQVLLKHVKKILGSTAFCVDENSGRLFSRMSYLFYPPRVNEDESGVFLSQQLFNQLKVDNGEMTYPKYKINKKEIIYKTRQDLVSFEATSQLENQILAAIEKKDFDHVINQLLPQAESGFRQVFSTDSSLTDLQLPSYLRNQTTGHVYVRCLNHIVSVLEQRKDHTKAVEVLRLMIEQKVYCQYYKGKWIERLAIDLEKHLKRPQDALQEIVNGLEDPEVKAGPRYTIYQRGQRLAKSLRSSVHFNKCSELDFDKSTEVTITAETLNRDVNGRRNIFTTTNDVGDITCISVEEAALRYYKESGFSRGLHSEGLVYHALLNLLLWDIIYSDVDDAFRTCNQSLPLDFSTEFFYIRRAKEINERLGEIQKFSELELAANLEHVWTENFGTSCLISWDNVDIQDLKDIAFCMGNEAMVAIFKRMCHHFRFTHSGFPDLLVWNVDTKKIRAVEVKGPNDSLSSKQILWMQYFNTHGFPAEVCYVKSTNKCRK